jgi:hypothetical protein
MDRRTGSTNPGLGLTLDAGGAASGATSAAGGNLTLLAGKTTGTGRSLAYVDTYAPATASGTGDNTAVHRVAHGGFLALTNNITTTVIALALTNSSVTSVVLTYGIEIVDGTNQQVEAGMVECHALNKAGTINVDRARCTKFGDSQDVESGTMQVDWTLTNANPALLQIKVNSSLTPSTGYPRLHYSLINTGSQQATLQ